MTKKQIVETAVAALQAVDADLIDQTTGEFKKQPDYADDAEFVSDVEKAYTAHGGTIGQTEREILGGIVGLLTAL